MRELLLTFSVAGRLYAVRTQFVREIVFLSATFSLPGQPRIVHGFVYLRGESIPVVSLRALFGDTAAEPDIYAPFVVIRGDGALALLADQVLDIIDPAAVQLQVSSATSSVNDCAESVFQTDAGDVTVLSLERLLLTQERERIVDLQRQIEARLVECEAGTR